MRLISATPSPYARKVRIALAEKGIAFDLVTEVPWNEDTTLPSLPLYNALEKVPVLRLHGRVGTRWHAIHSIVYLSLFSPFFSSENNRTERVPTRANRRSPMTQCCYGPGCTSTRGWLYRAVSRIKMFKISWTRPHCP